jgi:hypothetical protein
MVSYSSRISKRGPKTESIRQLIQDEADSGQVAHLEINISMTLGIGNRPEFP